MSWQHREVCLHPTLGGRRCHMVDSYGEEPAGS
ncbi:hypothetical protein Nmel_010646 [Mimus melanotis]